MVAAPTEFHGEPGGQRSDERGTTLLDLLFELRPQSDDSAQKLVRLAIAAITEGRAVLCGTYRGIDPARFNQQ